MNEENVRTPDFLWVDPTGEDDDGYFIAYPKAPRDGGYLNMDEAYIHKSKHDKVVSNLNDVIERQAAMLREYREPISFITHSQPSASAAVYESEVK